MQTGNEHYIQEQQQKKTKTSKTYKNSQKKKKPKWRGQKAFGFYTLLVSLVKVPP